MEIIRRGELPQERVYEAICSNCKTIFRFEEREAEKVSDQRDGDFLRIKCPVCDDDCCKNYIF